MKTEECHMKIGLLGFGVVGGGVYEWISGRSDMRESIAEICTKQYGMNLHPGDITDCYGCCATSGRLFSGCQNCKIRKCALLKNIESCAFCPEYACPTLLDHFTHEPEAKIRLEEIRKTNKY